MVDLVLYNFLNVLFEEFTNKISIDDHGYDSDIKPKKAQYYNVSAFLSWLIQVFSIIFLAMHVSMIITIGFSGLY